MSIDSFLDELNKLKEDKIEFEEVKEKAQTVLPWTVLSALVRKDRNFYKKLTDEEKKSFSLWIMKRWLSSIDTTDLSGEDRDIFIYYNLQFIAKKIEPRFGVLGRSDNNNSDLQWLLLTTVGHKGLQNVKFKPKEGKPSGNFVESYSYPKGLKLTSLEEEIRKIYPTLKVDEIDLILKINTQDDLREMFLSNGYEDDQIESLFS